MEQKSVFRQLATSPRIWALNAVLLPSAFNVGSTPVLQLQMAEVLFGAEAGFGILATTLTVAIGAGALLGGLWADRWNPRLVMLAAMLIYGTSRTVMGVLIMRDSLTVPGALIATAVEGFFMAVGMIALFRVQAGLVPVDSRGAAELLSRLRLALMACAAVLVMSAWENPGLGAVVCGLGLIIGGIAAFAVSRDATVPRVISQVRVSQLVAVVPRLRAVPVLLGIVGADLLMAFVIPTQFLNLTIVDQHPAAATAMMLAGVAGVLLGQLAISSIGLRWVRTALVVSFGAFGSLVLLGGFETRVLLDGQVVVLAVVIVGASAAMTYGQALLAALVQQASPDDIRGRLSGVVAASRTILAAIALAVSTYISARWDASALAIALGLACFAGIAATQAFRAAAVMGSVTR